MKILLVKTPTTSYYDKWNTSLYGTLIAMRKDIEDGVRNRIVLFKDGFSEIARTNDDYIKEACVELKEVK